MPMDSCGCQNKNNITLAYSVLWVILGHHQKVVLKFMTVMHTKFIPDRVLEMIRQQMKKEMKRNVQIFKKILSTMLLSSQRYMC